MLTRRNESLIFIISIIIVVISVPLAYSTIPRKYDEIVPENRHLTNFPGFHYVKDLVHALAGFAKNDNGVGGLWLQDQFIGRKFQEAVENASIDQFLLRIQITKVERDIERFLIRIAYLPFNDPVVPASFSSGLMVMRNEPRLLPFPLVFDDAVKAAIRVRVSNYKELIDRYPQTYFYALDIETIDISRFNPSSMYVKNADNGQGYKYFYSMKPEELRASILEIKSFQDFSENFFRTDHHLTMRGAWKAYEEAYKMLAQNYPSISPMLIPSGFFEVKDLKFLGSFARRVLYTGQPDKIEYVMVDLPPYETFVNYEKKVYGDKQNYLLGKFSSDPFDFHYEKFYGGNDGCVEYHFNNGYSRNLLIIGDSYTQTMEVYLAAHYQNTFVFDLRYEKNFDLGQMIQQYNIDDVLVLGDYSPVYLSSDWYIEP